jgi:hypothetical protein
MTKGTDVTKASRSALSMKPPDLERN